MRFTKEIRTGILVITGLLMTIFSFNYLKGINLFDKTRNFNVIYDNVEGLIPSNPVTINGYKVGKVQKISFLEDGSNKLVIKLALDNKIEFSKSSYAELYETGLIGGKAIAIIPNYDDNQIAVDGDFLNGKIKPGLTELVNQRLFQLQEKLESAITNADKVFVNVNDVFNDENKLAISDNLTNLKSLSQSLIKTSDDLNKIINGEILNKSLENIESTTAKLSKISSSISDSDIESILNNVNETVNSFNLLINKINNGNGSISKLLEDDSIFKNLDKATSELEVLINDIKTNPSRYINFSVFGKKNK
jgi:phospholipid/cholesterol/gamma-HCH transport system substrate-binding protein|tara:strand:- start:1162 stop:2079 length:918 start_codon:yes stop_codon:yes gene_type:complete